MIFEIVYGMTCSLYWAHTQILYSLLPYGQPVFIPVVQTTAYSTGIVNKQNCKKRYEDIFISYVFLIFFHYPAYLLAETYHLTNSSESGEIDTGFHYLPTKVNFKGVR
jgi:hypothetical protein